MTEPVAGIVRVKTPRSVVARSLIPAPPRMQTNSLLPLLLPASIAAAGMLWGLLRRRTRTAPEPEISVTVVALVHRVIEFR